MLRVTSQLPGTVVIAVISVRMMEAAIDDVINVISMLHHGMSAARAMVVVVGFRAVV